ncbi:MAG: NAD(P)H-dependent oxidoreductase [bacterium]|nr:NAD(P)H-dependent oxidoreductase [bacterium]
MSKRISILVASNGKNLELAREFESALNETGLTVSVIDLVDLDLPLFTPGVTDVPNAVTALIPELLATHGLMVIAPEYNGSTPPVLNNFIAWVSRTGPDFRGVFNGKPVAIASYSGGGTNILHIMRLQFAYLGANVIGRQLQVNVAKPAKLESIVAIATELTRLVIL